MIAIESLHMRQGDFVLEDIHLEIPTGGYGVLMGSTGCGKTTVLEAVAGLRRVQSGVIRIGQRDVTHLDPAERNTGYVPQDGAMFPTMTVFEQLAFPAQLRGNVDSDQINALAADLGIDGILDRLPQGLSGGERGRVALGRALMAQPDILLLDEPVAAVDEDRRAATVDLPRRVHANRKLTVLHITHSRSEAEALATHRFVMQHGKVEPKT